MPLRNILSVLWLVAATSGYILPNGNHYRPSRDIRNTTFRHPGLLHTASDFERITSKVQAKEEPWYLGWTKLTDNTDVAYDARPHATVIRGFNTNTNEPENYRDLFRDAAAAYALAAR